MTFPCYDESHSLERSSPFVKITAPLTWVSRLKPIDKRVSRKLVVVDMTFTDYFGIYPNRTSGFMLEIVLDLVSRLCAGSGSRDYATSYAICELNERRSSVLAALSLLYQLQHSWPCSIFAIYDYTALYLAATVAHQPGIFCKLRLKPSPD